MKEKIMEKIDGAKKFVKDHASTIAKGAAVAGAAVGTAVVGIIAAKHCACSDDCDYEEDIYEVDDVIENIVLPEETTE